MEITIKVGRKEYRPQAGDYILWNGACYQFCTGDGRALYSKKWTNYTAVRLPKSTVKKMPFHLLDKRMTQDKFGGVFTKWYF